MKNTFYILVIAFITLTTSCQRSIPDNFDYGSIENNTYKNKFFGMTLEIPDGWDVQSNAEQEALIKEAQVDLDNKEFDKMLKTADITSASLLMVSQFDTQSHTDSEVLNSNFNFTAENIGLTSIKDGKDYLDTLRKAMIEAQMPIKADEDTKSIEVDGQTFYYFDAVMTMNGMDIKQRYMATVMNGFSLIYVATYGTEEQLEKLMDVLKTTQFE
ncbi:MAG TPA: hypothetical protein DEO36_09805 [Flavobacteriaceae bacterium]|jgi:hypothetical protein|nr:hypothetical protein [Flavobacteriaceae bacterium]